MIIHKFLLYMQTLESQSPLSFLLCEENNANDFQGMTHIYTWSIGWVFLNSLLFLFQ